MNKRRFCFVRHGQTDWNVLGKIQGHTDIPLNDTGKKQARELAKILKETHFDLCISSDLSRAVETAQILIEGREISHTQDVRLREIHHGCLEGMHWKQYHEMLLLQRDEIVEKRISVVKRVFALLEETMHEKVLFVTHGGLMRSLLITLDPSFGIEDKVKVSNGGILQLSHEGERFVIESMQGIEIE